MADEKKKDEKEPLKLIASAESGGILFALCHDDSWSRLFTAGTDYAIYKADLRNEPLSLKVKTTAHNNYVSTLQFVNGALVSGSYSGRLIWTDADSGQEIISAAAHEGWVRDSAIFPDGSQLATVGDDMRVCLWNVRNGEHTASFEGHSLQTPEGYNSALYAVSVSPDGKWLASGDRVGAVCIWDLQRQKLLHKFRAPGFYTYDPEKRVRSIGGIRSLCFSPDGTKLAISGIGQVTNVDGFVGPCRVEVWDYREPARVFIGEGKHQAVLNHVAFHPKQPNLLVAAGGGDGGGVIAVWDQQNKAPIHMAKPKGHLQQFCINEAGTRLYAAGYGGVQVWEFTEEFSVASAKAATS